MVIVIYGFENLLEQMNTDSAFVIVGKTQEQYDNIITLYQAVLNIIPNSPNPFPITVQTLGVFLAYRKRCGCRYGTLKNTCSAIAFYCKKNNMNDVTKDQKIKDYMKSQLHLLQGGFSPCAANTLTFDELIKIISNVKENDHESLRDIAMMSLQFRLMIRISEVINLDFEDIEVAGDIYKIRIKKSKTDQSGVGRDLYLKFKQNIGNPILLLNKYSLNVERTGPLFKAFNIYHQPLNNRRITDSTIRRRYKKLFTAAGLDKSMFSTHSIRKVGARYAALNGATASTIQYTRGWRSSCFLKYTAVDAEDAFQDLDKIFQ